MIKCVVPQDRMLASSENQITIDDLTQEIHEQQLVIRIDYPRRQIGLQIRALVLHLLGFGILVFVGINPNKVQIGDLAFELSHNRFSQKAQVWIKMPMDWGDGNP
jgi:hypothetical protein